MSWGVTKLVIFRYYRLTAGRICCLNMSFLCKKNSFPFPLAKAALEGNYSYNRQGALKDLLASLQREIETVRKMEMAREIEIEG
jgi:hypothetical protein